MGCWQSRSESKKLNADEQFRKELVKQLDLLNKILKRLAEGLELRKCALHIGGKDLPDLTTYFKEEYNHKAIKTNISELGQLQELVKAVLNGYSQSQSKSKKGCWQSRSESKKRNAQVQLQMKLIEQLELFNKGLMMLAEKLELMEGAIHIGGKDLPDITPYFKEEYNHKDIKTNISDLGQRLELFKAGLNGGGKYPPYIYPHLTEENNHKVQH